MRLKVHSQSSAPFTETLIDKCVLNEEGSGESRYKGDKDKCRYKRGEARYKTRDEIGESVIEQGKEHDN